VDVVARDAGQFGMHRVGFLVLDHLDAERTRRACGCAAWRADGAHEEALEKVVEEVVERFIPDQLCHVGTSIG
jgi:hypothetical protein